MLPSSVPRVVIVQQCFPHYRRPFFEQLHDRLRTSGIQFALLYGPGGCTLASSHAAPWSHVVPVRKHWGFTWQPVLPFVQPGDLVIVEAAIKHLAGHVLLARHLAGEIRLCFWGHGRNFQADWSCCITEAAKRIISRQAHWWFAYNDLSARLVRNLGFPAERITSVHNAIDTTRLTSDRRNLTVEQITQMRRSLGLLSDNVCIYTGSMYREKRLPFLMEACHHVRRDIPDFEMIFIGTGPDAHIVQSAAAAYPWMHYVGPKQGPDMAAYWACAKALLLPSAVGLVILDSFALGTPLVTTTARGHGPEIDYLIPGINGEVVNDARHPQVYARAIVSLLRDEPRRQRLAEGARESATRYTIENMAERFCGGILSALSCNATSHEPRQHAPCHPVRQRHGAQQ